MLGSTKPLHSSTLQASPASSSAFSANGTCPGPVGASRKTRALTRTALPAALAHIPASDFQSSTVDSPSLIPFLAALARVLRSRRKTSRVTPLFATLTENTGGGGVHPSNQIFI
jgi:hypothetical protein